jgi:translation elongation factor EF-Tu-like GTPase
MAGRPKLYSDLINRMITVEREVMEELEKMGFRGKVSEICRDALLQATNNPALKKKYDKFERVLPKTKKLVIEVHTKDPANVEGCLRILKRHTGINFSPMEFLTWVDREKEGG